MELSSKISNILDFQIPVMLLLFAAVMEPARFHKKMHLNVLARMDTKENFARVIFKNIFLFRTKDIPINS